MREDMKELINKCDFISIDTSALMSTEALKKFLNDYSDVFLSMGKEIFIYREVIGDLKILCHSSIEDESTRAECAFDLLYDFYEIFRCEDEPDKIGAKIGSHTASQRLLGATTWYKPYHSQMFISNDERLLESIIKVDQQDAVPGKNVYTIKLTKDGDLEPYTESEEYIKKHVALETAVKKSYTATQRSGMLLGGVLGAVLVSGIKYLLRSSNRV